MVVSAQARSGLVGGSIPTASVSVAVEVAGAGSDPICSGMKAGAPPPSSPSRYSFRHRVSRERESPYRRAVAEPWRCPRKLSSTMRIFSASDRSRRRPVSSAERTSKSEMTVEHAIAHDLRLAPHPRPDGLRRRDTAEPRRADLLQLEEIAASYLSAEAFLTELTLDPPDASSDQAGPPLKDDDYLVLSTIHSAKGQEWRAVYILNTVDGCIPSDLGTAAEIEEERRLLYVAMTKAKDSLTLGIPCRFYVTQQRSNGDRHVRALRTRFISNDMLGQFELVQCRPQMHRAEDYQMPRPAPINVAASMRGMWE